MLRRDRRANIKIGFSRAGGTAVVIATPNHGHHDQLVESLKAGKDVYQGKPMTFSIEEGARIFKAVYARDRVVQIGMQCPTSLAR